MKQQQGAGQGLTDTSNPLDVKRAKGDKPPQAQEWPGHEAGLTPPADHGEKSYVGAGKLKGKRALVTGGDSGIGRAVAIAFAREGAEVAIAYYNERDDAQETVKWLDQAGVRSLAIQVDLSSRDRCRETIQQVVDEFGGIDILVNNAARQTVLESIADLTPEILERTFQTNFFAFVWLAQAALEHMEEGGVILNTGSVQAYEPSPELFSYSATKAAIHNFTKALAQEVSERGIRVNCVAPGPVWTPLIVSTFDDEKIKSFGSNTAWGRPAQPAEMASSFVFLASADGRFYTGEILAPTGTATTR